MQKSSLALVGHIYDAVLDPAQWDSILDELADILGVGATSIQVIDPLYSSHQYTALSSRFRDNPGMESLSQEYFDDIWKHEEIIYRSLFNKNEQGFQKDYISMGFNDASDLEHHIPSIWIRKHFGLFHRIASRLNLNNAWQDLLSIQFDASHGEASEEEMQAALIFLPHLAKAIEMRRQFNVLHARFNAVLDALNHYQVGTFIVSGQGDILLHNTEAQRLIEDKDGLSRDARGRLVVTSRSGNDLLSLIQSCTLTARGEGLDSEKLMTIKRLSGQEDYILTVAPIRDPKNTIEAQFQGAIVYVIDPSNVAVISTAGMSELYGLTKAENEVCRLLVEGLTTADIAELRCVCPETVRSQTKQIMQKTSTQNRASLIRLALSINLPIEQPPG